MSIAVGNKIEVFQLAKKLRRSQRSRRINSFLLISPLLFYVLLTFILPIAMMFYKAVENSEVITAFPQTTAQLARWDNTNPDALPSNAVYLTFAQELASASRSSVGEAARRLNYEITGYRSLLTSTVRKIGKLPVDIGTGENAKAFLSEIDSRWGAPEFWHAMQRSSAPYTSYYMLAAVDLRLDDNRQVVQAPEEQRTYIDILVRTIEIAAIVSIICLILGYPLANLMLNAPKPFAIILMIAVMLPFWTSLLARTSAWIVLLQREGLINTLLSYIGLINQPLELIFNATGLYIVMVHMMLPFMVLPIYSTMKGIPPQYIKASASLGANPFRSFYEVYLPMTLPGVGAGALLTFIVTTGYYITPSLVGSARDQMLGYFIAFFANTTINWGMASALGIILLLCTLCIYLVATRTVGVRQLAGLK